MPADYDTDNAATVDARTRAEPVIEIEDDSPEAGINALRKQIEEAEARVSAAEQARDNAHNARQAESAARAEAERRAGQYQREVAQHQRSASEAQYDSIVNGLAAAQGELAGAKAALENAAAEGDFKKVAEMSAEIGMIAAKVREFESGKVAWESRRNEGGDTYSPQPQPSDERE